MCTSLGNSLKNLHINIAGKNLQDKRHEYLEEVPQNLVLEVQPTPMTPMEVNHRKHKHLNLQIESLEKIEDFMIAQGQKSVLE